MQNRAASLFTKPTPLNINLGSDRFSMFNKERDIRFRDWDNAYSFLQRIRALPIS
jgi:hypothetical protein